MNLDVAAADGQAPRIIVNWGPPDERPEPTPADNIAFWRGELAEVRR